MTVPLKMISHTGLLQSLLVCFFSVIVFTGCSGSSTGSDPDGPAGQLQFSDGWIIPENEILDGGPGVDGIRSIDQPAFVSPDSEKLSVLRDNRMVTGIRIGDEIRAYPHQILDWHEVVNDQIAGIHFAITFCPLTGTDIAWHRNSNEEYGVSGLIFRNNLILYDRSSFSRYSQMQIRGVNGPRSGTNLEQIPVVQTTWKTWKEIYPDSRVLSPDTGFDFDYRTFLYGENYLSGNSGTLFPRLRDDGRLDRKERVHGIISGTADENARVIVFPIVNFSHQTSVYYHEWESQKIVIAGNSSRDIAVSFLRTLPDGTLLEFEPLENSWPVMMKDDEGTFWDIFGYATEGPRKGERLQTVRSYTGYWFAWVDFFPNLTIGPF